MIQHIQSSDKLLEAHYINFKSNCRQENDENILKLADAFTDKTRCYEEAFNIIASGEGEKSKAASEALSLAVSRVSFSSAGKEADLFFLMVVIPATLPMAQPSLGSGEAREFGVSVAEVDPPPLSGVEAGDGGKRDR